MCHSTNMYLILGSNTVLYFFTIFLVLLHHMLRVSLICPGPGKVFKYINLYVDYKNLRHY